MEISMEVAQEAKNRTTYDLAIPFLGLYPKECKAAYSIDTSTPRFITALFTIAELWNQSNNQ
jgi:hypothetical protein